MCSATAREALIEYANAMRVPEQVNELCAWLEHCAGVHNRDPATDGLWDVLCRVEREGERGEHDRGD